MLLFIIGFFGTHAGKTGVGKSSTTNSIFAERVANVMVMQSDTSKAQSFARTAAGFTLTIIDTPGALEGDAVNGAVLPWPHPATVVQSVSSPLIKATSGL